MSDPQSPPDEEHEVPGGTRLSDAQRELMLRRHTANLDDPIARTASGERGAHPQPDFRGSVGRVAIVQAQVYIVGAIMITQLFLVTTALYELLSGNKALLWSIAAASLVGFLIALLVALWPRRAVKDF